MKLWTIEYREWNDGAPGGQWFWCGKAWAASMEEALELAKTTYGKLGNSYRASLNLP